MAKAAATPASQAATVVQNAASSAPATTTQTTAPRVARSDTRPGRAVLTHQRHSSRGFKQLIYNTIAQFPTGGWGLGLTNGNLNSMRQILQAYFAVGLGNFGFGIGQQTITPAQATALFNPGAAGACVPRRHLRPRHGGTAGVSGAPFTASSVGQMGEASTLGRLSVPAGWQGATPAEMEEAQLASAARPVAPQSNGMLNGVPMAGNAGLGAPRRRRLRREIRVPAPRDAPAASRG